MAIWIFCGNFGRFFRFGLVYKEKYGNPGRTHKFFDRIAKKPPFYSWHALFSVALIFSQAVHRCCHSQGDRIGRFIADWVFVYFSTFINNKNSPNFLATFS
jgi:hypothetical protein